MNSTYTNLSIWSEYISKTELPIFSKPTVTNNMQIKYILK